MTTTRTYHHAWFYTATVGLGLCIASTKTDRSTALWNVARLDIASCVLIVLTLLVSLALLLALRRKQDLSTSYGLLIVLNVLQIIYFVCKAFGDTVPWARLVCIVLSQVPVLLFLIFASFYIEIGIRKSMTSIVVGTTIAGILQILTATIPQNWALVLSMLLFPGASVLLVVSTGLRSPAVMAAEREDLRVEDSLTESRISRTKFAEYCLSLLFLNTLGIILYCSGLSYQGSGNSSLSIQVLSGVGTLLGGLTLVFVMKYLQSLEVLELLRVVLFPLIIAVIYLSSILGGASLSAYFIPLGVFFAALILLVWTVPKQFHSADDERGNFRAFACVGVTYVCFRVGWALGIVTGSVFPRTVSGYSTLPVICFCFVALTLLIVRGYFRLLRSSNAREGDFAACTEGETENKANHFAKACADVGTRFGLSERETEVLELLARGRNAKYIANKLIISEGTARTHINHIYRKMGVKSQQVLMDLVEETERNLS